MGLNRSSSEDVSLIDLNSSWDQFSDLDSARRQHLQSSTFTMSTSDDVPVLPVTDNENVFGDFNEETIHLDHYDPDSSSSQPASASRTRKPRRMSTTRQHLHLDRQTSASPPPQETTSAIPPVSDDSTVFFTAGSPPATSGLLAGNDVRSASPSVQPCCGTVVNRMRWRIKFFFMDPIQKWKARHQFPWKLFLQVIKIVFVTIQLVMFGNERYAFANFLNQNTVSFRHLMLHGWADQDIPVAVYPNSGLFACYLKTDVYEKMDFAVNQFMDLRNIAIGTYHHASGQNDTAHFQICKREFMDVHIFPQNHSYIYDSGIQETCLTVEPVDVANQNKKRFSTESYLADKNASLVFDKLVDAKLIFGVKSVALDPNDPDDEPDCYVFDIVIHFDNTGHNGQIQVALELDPHVVPCNGKMLFPDGQSVWDILVDVLDATVLIISILSLLLCLRALYNAELLKKAVMEFFKTQFGVLLSKDEQLEFLNLWYVMIVVNDVLIICGTVIKLKISAAAITELPLYNACGLLLGVGNLLVWIGVLRYLGFFRTYNILILTFKRAIPNVLRYMACIVLIFAGFSFCGWIVLGPYHLKFQTFHSTAECLFSLINGDDMFATFAILPFRNSMIWYFSRIYLYSFICMFTYVVLSLMISLIMDAYGTVKDFYEQGGPSSRLSDFIHQDSSVTVLEECGQHQVYSSFASSGSAAYDCHRTWCGCFAWLRKKTRDVFDSPDEHSSWVPHDRLVD